MPIQLYNTLTRTKEPLDTIEPGVVRMYVCGVTVYDQAHVGHAMSALVFDIIRRYLEYRGYEVRHVVNFTDVDDKIINRANALGRDPKELAESYVAEFFEQLKALNVLPATAYPRATETMPEIIRFIAGLIESGHAYEAGGDVYFRVVSDPDYGKLSGRRLEDMLAGTRFDVDERKESPADFALWKAAKPGEPFWPSPWSDGRPGWHIECSAMSLKELGPQIDIHGGGNDLVFPHHENEIAQTESLTGEEFARFWVHNGMLQIHTRIADGTVKYEKMSKSLGNVVNISDFLREHDADVLRLIVLSSYYRSPLLYGAEIVADQERKLDRLRSALEPANGDIASGAAVDQLTAVLENTRARFAESMDDDFNMSGALAALFELAGVLGLELEAPRTAAQEAAPFIELLIELRAELRKAKQYALADLVRTRLAALDITLEDGPQGTRWKTK